MYFTHFTEFWILILNIMFLEIKKFLKKDLYDNQGFMNAEQEVELVCQPHLWSSLETKKMEWEKHRRQPAIDM